MYQAWRSQPQAARQFGEQGGRVVVGVEIEQVADGDGQADQLAHVDAVLGQRTGEQAGRGVQCLFVHGSPSDPTWGYVYPDTPLEEFDDVTADVVFMGHTHRPFVRISGATTFVNVGSCGMPRDGDPRGAAALFDTTSGEATILRFDIAEPSRRALAAHASLHETVVSVLRRLSGELSAHA